MSAAYRSDVDVQVACDDAYVPPEAFIVSWVGDTLAAAGRNRDAGTELSLRIVDRDEIRALNRDYRALDKATNVLSFPAGPIAGLPAGAPEPLGDVVICAAVVAGEAGAEGKSLDAHWAHMLVHGVLHLLGYDHQTTAEAHEMESLETRILLQRGLPDPYGESR